MFEKSKFKKLEKSGESLCELKVFLPLDAPKKAVVQVQNSIKQCFGNFCVQKNAHVQITTLAPEHTMELQLGAVMDVVFAVKELMPNPDGLLKISVNDTFYEI